MHQSLGEALRLVRSFHDISQIELANSLDISRSYLSELENGRKMPSMDLLLTYAKFFDIPLSSLMLFSETIEDGSVATKAKKIASQKALELLKWIENRRNRNRSLVA